VLIGMTQYSLARTAADDPSQLVKSAEKVVSYFFIVIE